MFSKIKVKFAQFFFEFITSSWGFASNLLQPFLVLNPLVLRLRITNRCNLSCHFCYLGNSLNIKSENILSLEEWQKIINNIPRYTIIDITGGEPFLTPHFNEILSMMLTRKLKVSLITNGTISRPEVLKTIVDQKLTYFMISLDGLENEHDEIRGKGSFQKSINTLKEVIKLKKLNKQKLPMVICKVNLSESNHLSLDQLYDYLLNEIKIDGITTNLLFENSARDGFPNAKHFQDAKLWSGNKFKYAEKHIHSLQNELKSLVNKYSHHMNVKPSIRAHEYDKYIASPNSFRPQKCYKYRSVSTMYFDGTLTPCDLGISIGNIREINYNMTKVMSLHLMQEFDHFFKSKNFSLPGCEGCCLKTNEPISEN